MNGTTIRDLQNALLLFQVHAHMRRNGIGQAAGLIDPGQGGKYLGGDFLAAGGIEFAVGKGNFFSICQVIKCF